MTSTHIPNIGPKGAKRRAAGGFVWAAVAVIALIVMLALRATPIVRVLVALPVFLAAIGFLQAREKT